MLDLATRMEGHPDNVSPCLMGGFTVSSVADGRVTCVRTAPPEKLLVVVAVPDYEIETHAARALLPGTVPHSDAVFNVSRSAMVTAALITGQLDALRTALDDRLHQPYRMPLVPGFEAVQCAAVRAGALGAFLSGAGPAILAFAQTNADDVAEAMKGAWRDDGVIASADVVEIDPIGVTLE
jgi:homoserine kinase